MKIKSNAENKNTKTHDLIFGDYVLVEQDKVNKWTVSYESTVYMVHKIRGSTIMACRVTDGQVVCLNSTFFKYIDQPRKSKGPEEKEREKQRPDNWREAVLRKTKIGKPIIHDRDNGADEPNRIQEPGQIETIPRRS